MMLRYSCYVTGAVLPPATHPPPHHFTGLGHLVAHLIALVEGLEPLACYAGVVHEDILASIVRFYEAVTFVLTEPLDRPFLGHALLTPQGRDELIYRDGSEGFVARGPSAAQFNRDPRYRLRIWGVEHRDEVVGPKQGILLPHHCPELIDFMVDI